MANYIREEVTKTHALRLRKADATDMKMVFEWRNDEWIVSLSESQRLVSWEEHEKWFINTIDNNAVLYYIIEVKQNDKNFGAIGSIRLTSEQLHAVVTIYLLKPYCGLGWGYKALLDAINKGFAEWPHIQCIWASIRSDNIPSIKMFEKAGFIQVNEENIVNHQMIKMVLKR